MLDFHTLLTMTSCIKNLLPELALIMASTWFMVLNQLLFCKQYNLIQFVSTSTYLEVYNRTNIYGLQSAFFGYATSASE